MDAYGVFAGGGVRAIALVGALARAEKEGVKFVGHGGASAGSVIALLANVGYTGETIKELMLGNVHLRSFLDDRGSALRSVRRVLYRLGLDIGPGKRSNWFQRGQVVADFLARKRYLVDRMVDRKGLYNGLKAIELLQDLVVRQIGGSPNQRITFESLLLKTGRPLKIICTDVRKAEPVIYPNLDVRFGRMTSMDTPVLLAVRASMGFPLLFEPYSLNQALLVDGGMSSNLPVVLFDHERIRNRIPIIAFDLENDGSGVRSAIGYSFYNYLLDLASASVGASEKIIQQYVKGVHYVPVKVPRDILLDFFIPSSRQLGLYEKGFTDNDTKDALERAMRQEEQVAEQDRYFQNLMRPLLRSLVYDIETGTKADHCRASIMLATPQNTRRVIYQYRMDSDPDRDLEIGLTAGTSGVAWSTRNTVKADLERVQDSGLTQEQQDLFNAVTPPRKAMMSAPLFGFSQSIGATTRDKLELIGTLTIDTSTRLGETGWYDGPLADGVTDLVEKWADIVSSVLYLR
jgi:NTE family protein